MGNEMQEIIARLDRIEKAMASQSPWLTLEECAMYLRLPVKEIKACMKDRKIPYYTEGNTIIFKREELDDWEPCRKRKSKRELEIKANTVIEIRNM